MLVVNHRICIPDDELEWTFVRSGGPGGQNVNKVASRAVLRWHVQGSPSLPADVKARFLAQNRRRINDAGELLLSSQRFRDQGRNVADCLDKLRELVHAAIAVPKARKATRPSRGAKEARLREKRRRAGIKSVRRKPAEE